MIASELEPFGHIVPRDDGTWEPAEPGEGMLVKLLQVWGLEDELIDVVAWRFGDPSPWWLRWGYANYLGLHEVTRAKRRTLTECPTRIVATPAEWLRDRGEAICILNWNAPLLPLMDELGEVTCSTPGLEKRLREALAAEAGHKIRIRGAA